MPKRIVLLLCAIECGVLLHLPQALAQDWPTWRADSRRRACIEEPLPGKMSLLWSRDLGDPKPCWPFTQYKLQFDRSYEPVVSGNRLFVGSMVEDCVTAYETETGEEIWKTFVDGPVRFAPAVWNDRVFFVSDDGFLYCADAGDGTILWKVRGGPSDYRVFGNERLVSMWPARGGPVLYEGTVYFAASVWPFMGVFIHAVDAKTGEIVWTNSGSSSSYILQPHSSPAFAGVAPQGYLAATEDKLFVAGGRSVPAVYDRLTGELLYYEANTKYGGYEVAVADDYHCTFGALFDSSDGSSFGFRFAKAAVVEGTTIIECQMPVQPRSFGEQHEGMIRSVLLKPEIRRYTDRRGRRKKEKVFPVLWELRKPIDRVFFKAGSRIYCGTGGMIAAVRVPEAGTGASSGNEEGTVPLTTDFAWQAPIDGDPFTAIAGDRKLFVVTREGVLYCFGDSDRPPIRYPRNVSDPQPSPEWADRADHIVRERRSPGAYGAFLGVGSGGLVESLVAKTDLHWIVFESDEAKRKEFRRRWSEKGIYGRRVSIVPDNITAAPLSPYFAVLITAEDDSFMRGADPTRMLRTIFRCLRPYGGTALLPLGDPAKTEVAAAVKGQGWPNAQWRQTEEGVILAKVGPLPGSAPWTHQYGDIGNTVFSKDRLVKAPLGILWFGGPSHLDVLPRHGHGPPQQIVGGRLFIQGIHVLSARDVYSGRILWRKEIPELDTFGLYYTESYVDDPYDLTYNQRHHPGANQYGTNFVVTEDSLYLNVGEACLVLDPSTGDTSKVFLIPDLPGVVQPNWGYIGVWRDYLIATAVPQKIEEKGGRLILEKNNRFGTDSKYLVVMNRHSGQLLWTYQADASIRHNTIVAGNGKVFCMDSLTPKRLALLRRRGLASSQTPKILAFDLASGKEVWRTEEKVFGTWLGYSEEFDVLFQGGSAMGDRARDEVRRGMAAYRGEDGNLLWSNDEEYGGPCILRHDWVITQTGGSNTHAPPAKAFHLLTGEPIETLHPITGQPVRWNWLRFKGCNTAIACENLLTFRSASAAFVDLTKNLGTSTIGGFRSGCTSNLIAADGVLNAPDYTRTCTCAYQNQTSLALIHMPEEDANYPVIEGWSFNFYPSPKEPAPIRKVGINLGAPGDRMDSKGVLWLEFPSVGGPSPELSIDLEGDRPRLYRHHATLIDRSNTKSGAASPPWVAASGVEGEVRMKIHPYLFPARSRENDIQGFEKNAHDIDLTAAVDIALPATATERIVYTVRFHFAETENLQPGDRVFDVWIDGQPVLSRFDVVREAGGVFRGISREVRGVEGGAELVIELKSSNPDSDYPPILSGIELIAENLPGKIDS